MKNFDEFDYNQIDEIFLENDGFQSFELKLDQEKTLIEKTVYQE